MYSIFRKFWFGESTCSQCGKKYIPSNEQIDADKLRISTCSHACYLDHITEIFQRQGC